MQLTRLTADQARQIQEWIERTPDPLSFVVPNATIYPPNSHHQRSSCLVGRRGLIRPINKTGVEGLKQKIRELKGSSFWWADSAGEAMDKVDTFNQMSAEEYYEYNARGGRIPRLPDPPRRGRGALRRIRGYTRYAPTVRIDPHTEPCEPSADSPNGVYGDRWRLGIQAILAETRLCEAMPPIILNVSALGEINETPDPSHAGQAEAEAPE